MRAAIIGLWRPGRAGVARMLSLLVLGLATTGCTAEVGDSSAPYFATDRPAATSPIAPITGTGVPALPSASPGPVSRPVPSLNPGAVVEQAVSTVCQQAGKVRDRISYQEQEAVFAAYRLPYPQDAKKYGLDYLIPLQLGGSPVQANLWPASHRGIGFHEKERLNVRLRDLVCQGRLSLGTVQRQLVTDWYALWQQYGAG